MTERKRAIRAREQEVEASVVATRRRGAELEEALLEAAWTELQEVGYEKLTMEAVADRAGTSRAVLYRRWSGRPELVIAAMRKYRPMLTGETPDTGTLRGDIVALLQRMSDRLTELGPDTIYGILGDYFKDAELFSRVQSQVLQTGSGVMASFLARAEERGEISGAVSERISRLPTDLFRQELFSNRAPPEEKVIIEIVDDIFLPLVGYQDKG